ncbi:DNA-binding transcriptional regulator, MarR family [Propionibacterium cyclohexanicum]|uniref:DNA-binding transcriptional regulator, MarR family n=1 Tax=Propionibacterium cyclohexanicum TaxID=64702 RepID=A0A1H9RHP5_9ACTN|nr:MarR family winged helix-turn-helix transcriptional regulator [Propionibacterium cyclohexanicum]SER72214.1 DNA-binding transcriptional regulator, MarR family [Propionibacterium cyclohexanicum]
MTSEDPGYDSDEVDALVASWSRERPDVDVSSLEIWSRVWRLSQILSGVRAGAYQEHDLAVWEFDVLSALRKLGLPYRASVGQLMRDNHVTSGTMTNRVDRLAERQFVRRRPDPHDRRSVLVELTAAGRERVDGALSSLARAEARMLAGIDEADRRVLQDRLRALLASQDGDE